jgi:beta-lactamase class A
VTGVKALLKVAGLGVWAAMLGGAGGAQENLRVRVMSIATEAKGQVSTACLLPGSKLNCSMNEMGHPPMQSVFKLPVVITALHQVERGKLSLKQKVRFLASDRILPHTHSALQDKYPKGDVDVPLEALLHGAIVDSDNVAADIVLRAVGGPQAVNQYITLLGVVGFHLENGEDGLASDPKVQFNNWFEPIGAVGLLDRLAGNSPLTPEHTKLVFGWMEHLNNGEHRIPGNLPPGTVVAHKTGSSGEENGVAAATNDIGLITLPDGRKLAVAVFITNSHADEATREAVIAKIARAAYDEALRGAAATPKH